MHNILYLFHSNNLYNGVDQTTLTLINNLNKEEFQPVAVVPDEGLLLSHLEEIGIETYLIPQRCCWGRLPNENYHFYKYLESSSDRVKRIKKIVREREISIIHTNVAHVLDGAIAALETNVSHVWHVHSLFECDYGIFSSYLSPENFGAILTEFCESIVAVSKVVKDSYARYVPDRKIEVIHNGIELKNFEMEDNGTNSALRKELGIDENKLLVCSIGRISEEKKITDFISAGKIILKNRNDVVFLIVGSSGNKLLEKKLKEQISESGLEKHYYLMGHREDVPKILSEVDLFVSSSLYEGFPLVCLEAMASGKPVVATQSGGPQEIIDDGITGFLVGVNNPDEMAEKIIRLLENPQLRNEMGVNGREKVEQFFSSRVYAREFETLYNNMLKQKKTDTGSKLLPEMVINLLGELGRMGQKSVKHETRIKQLENFERQFKDNFIYRNFRKIYHRLYKK